MASIMCAKARTQTSNRPDPARTSTAMPPAPTLQWLLANARSLCVKNASLPPDVAGWKLEIFCPDATGSLQPVLCSTIDVAGCFPAWTLSGLSATVHLPKHVNSSAICCRLVSVDGPQFVEETFDLARLLPAVSASSVMVYPANFFCIDVGGVLYTSERLFHCLPTRGGSAPPPVLSIDDEDAGFLQSDDSAQALRLSVLRLQREKGSSAMTAAHRARLERAREALAQERVLLRNARDGLARGELALQTSVAEIDQRLQQHVALTQQHVAYQACVQDKCRLLAKLKFLLEAREVKLLSDLQQIYPIERSDSGAHFIRGLELPVDVSTAKDEEAVASALGYVVHLVLLASKYLEVPLRYQLLFMGSRSLIRDPVLAGQDNTFPLFRKSIEKERFERAVAWLRGDVEQLLSSRGLAYDAARPLLQNLAALFDCDLCGRLAV